MNFIKKYKNLILLVLIILLATFLRLYQLGNNPPSLTWDEAAWGYNAYSLGIDGKDEFGRFLPITYLESFGDFKPPVYAYLDILPVKIFGLNEFATRFPSAMFGVFTVFIAFLLVRRIFWKSKNADNYALLSSLILAISPWHIMLSRAAFEANVATLFLATGVWAFLAAVQDKKWFLIISAISFALSMYTFNTSRVFAPMIVIILVVAFRKKLLVIKKETVISALIGLLMVFPLIPFLLTPQAGLRFREVNIFSNPDIVKMANQEITNDNNAVWSKIIHNRRTLFGIEYLVHYFDNLSPLFLWTRGDGNPKFSIQSVGEMYVWEVIFFVAGAFFLFRKREGNWWLIPIWLLVGIIPAATARETPHALRIETTLPTFQIIIAYGLYNLISALKQNIFGIAVKKVAIALVVFFELFNFIYFYHEYYSQYPYEYSAEWQYGYRQSIDYVKSVQNNYDKIQVTTALGRPYVYYLFYMKTLPSDFRNTMSVARDPFGFVTVNSFGKYSFPDNFVYPSKTGKTLYIGSAYNLPKNSKILKTFDNLDGSGELVAYE